MVYSLTRKKGSTIVVPLELKKTTVIQTVNNIIDSDLLFPGTIIINILGIPEEKKSTVAWQLKNITTNVLYNTVYYGNKTLTNMPVGEWQIILTTIDGYRLESPNNQYLGESKTITFNVNFSSNITSLLGKVTIDIANSDGLGGWKLIKTISGTQTTYPSDGSYIIGDVETVLTEQPYGLYNIQYKGVSGKVSPTSQSLILNSDNNNIVFTGSYMELVNPIVIVKSNLFDTVGIGQSPVDKFYFNTTNNNSAEVQNNITRASSGQLFSFDAGSFTIRVTKYSNHLDPSSIPAGFTIVDDSGNNNWWKWKGILEYGKTYLFDFKYIF